MNSNLIFTSNIFHLLSHALDVHRALQAPIHTPSEEAPTRERERDREPRKPKLVAPPASRTVNPRTQDRCTANPRTASRTTPIAPASRTTNPQTRKPVTDLVLVLVWNFCYKICLWFWFFTFSLWSQIFFVVVVVVVWVVVFWWFSCCVVVGFVWMVVENSIFIMLPNTWKYFLEKFS